MEHHYSADSGYIHGSFHNNPAPAAYGAGGVPPPLFPTWPPPHDSHLMTMISFDYAYSNVNGVNPLPRFHQYRRHSRESYAAGYGHIDQYGRRNPPPALGRPNFFNYVDYSAVLHHDHQYPAEVQPPFHHDRVHRHDHGSRNSANDWNSVDEVLILEGLYDYIIENDLDQDNADDLLQHGIITSTDDYSDHNPMNYEAAVTQFLGARRTCDGGDSEICVICQQDLTSSMEEEEEDDRSSTAAAVVLLDCGHCYHWKCIQQWLILRKNLCPLCRAPVLIPID